MASGTDDRKVKIWSLPEGKLLSTIEGYTYNVPSVAMNSEGTLLATANEHAVRIIKIESLYSLSCLPRQQGLKHLSWIEETLQREDITPNQRSWLEFILALGNRYSKLTS